MGFFELAGAVRIAAGDFALVAGPQFLGGFRVAERGRTEDRRVILLGRGIDGDGVGQRAGDRLVDEAGLVRFEDRQCLLQVGAPVVGFEQDAVNSLQEFVDGINDFHSQWFDLFDVFRHALRAGDDVGTPLGISRHDAAMGNVLLGILGVQCLGEGNHVGSIEANDADLDVRRIGGGELRGERHDEEGGKEGEARHGWLRGENLITSVLSAVQWPFPPSFRRCRFGRGC